MKQGRFATWRPFCPSRAFSALAAGDCLQSLFALVVVPTKENSKKLAGFTVGVGFVEDKTGNILAP